MSRRGWKSLAALAAYCLVSFLFFSLPVASHPERIVVGSDFQAGDEHPGASPGGRTRSCTARTRSSRTPSGRRPATTWPGRPRSRSWHSRSRRSQPSRARSRVSTLCRSCYLPSPRGRPSCSAGTSRAGSGRPSQAGTCSASRPTRSVKSRATRTWWPCSSFPSSRSSCCATSTASSAAAGSPSTSASYSRHRPGSRRRSSRRSRSLSRSRGRSLLARSHEA